jgi:hypothetical protein
VASRADKLPDAPRIRASIRAAGIDFYFQSIRLVMANLAWGVCLLINLIIAAFFSPLLGLLLSPLLAIPLVGVFRLAAIIARGETPDFSDVTAAWYRYARPALLLGAALVFAATVLIVDAVGAASSGSTVAWILATLAGWGMLGIGTYALIAWPILVDPRREQMNAGQRLRLAGLLLAAFPGRMVGLAIVSALILIASTIAFAALISISLAFVALLACRYVLPAADRLEARLNRVAGEAHRSQDVQE